MRTGGSAPSDLVGEVALLGDLQWRGGRLLGDRSGPTGYQRCDKEQCPSGGAERALDLPRSS